MIQKRVLGGREWTNVHWNVYSLRPSYHITNKVPAMLPVTSPRSCEQRVLSWVLGCAGRSYKTPEHLLSLFMESVTRVTHVAYVRRALRSRCELAGLGRWPRTEISSTAFAQLQHSFELAPIDFVSQWKKVVLLQSAALVRSTVAATPTSSPRAQGAGDRDYSDCS